MKARTSHILWIGAAVVIAAAIGYAFVPQPVEVDVSHVDRGPLTVPVGGGGSARV